MRVLVVEDDPDLNRQLVSALTDAGYAVDKATDGGLDVSVQIKNSGGMDSDEVPQVYLGAPGQAPEGVFGVTVPLLQLLEQHYVVAYAGVGSAGDRTAQVVEAWRSDGSIAARLLQARTALAGRA